MTYFADLVEGYHRFRTSDLRRQRDRWLELREGQSPKVMVIACSDSRVEPSQIFDTLPGEIFVVRNVAALVPPFETRAGFHGVSAALEFAVTKLKVEEIVVMGHGACGGCNAALTDAFRDAEPGEGGFIASWVSILDDARETVKNRCGDGPEAAREMEYEAVRTSLTNLQKLPVRTKGYRRWRADPARIVFRARGRPVARHGRGRRISVPAARPDRHELVTVGRRLRSQRHRIGMAGGSI